MATIHRTTIHRAQRLRVVWFGLSFRSFAARSNDRLIAITLIKCLRAEEALHRAAPSRPDNLDRVRPEYLAHKMLFYVD